MMCQQKTPVTTMSRGKHEKQRQRQEHGNDSVTGRAVWQSLRSSMHTGSKLKLPIRCQRLQMNQNLPITVILGSYNSEFKVIILIITTFLLQLKRNIDTND